MRFAKRRLGLLMMIMCVPLMAQTVVEEHWSPYDYPKEIPEGTQFHIIAEGDSLWSITERYLGDPLLWPQVYASNPYILDPNLIYPGDPVILDVGTVVTDAGGASDGSGSGYDAEGADGSTDAESGEFAEMDELGDDGMESMGDDEMQGEEDISDVSEVTEFDADSAEFVILPAGDRSDMECSTYLYPMTDANEILPFDIKVSGGENRSLRNFGNGDVIYLNKGYDNGVEAGALFSVRRELQKVYAPDQTFLGSAIDQVGKVKILAAQPDSAIAMVLPSCYNVKKGDFLVPYEQEPIPLITELPSPDRYAAFSSENHGYIVHSEDNLRSFGKGHLTNIDMGIDKNVAPGDLFIIFRDNPANSEAEGVSLPEIFLGHGVALKASSQTTVMKVIAGVSEITVGDKVVPLNPGTFLD